MIKFDLTIKQLEDLELLKPRAGYKVLKEMRQQAADKLVRLQAIAKTETVTTVNGSSQISITETAETKMRYYGGILVGIDLLLEEIEGSTAKVRKKQPVDDG